MRDLGTATTTLVSRGSAGCGQCGNGAFDGTFAGVDAGGEEVFFTTAEQLAPTDTDAVADLYVRHIPDPANPAAEETELVSTPPASCPSCGNGEFTVSPRGISADGSHAYFVTGERLSTGDTDSTEDIYAHALGGATTLVSTGDCTSACGNSGEVPVFKGSSVKGTRVFFSTREGLVDADHDNATDVYARDLTSDQTMLVSGAGEDKPAEFEAASSDGSHVFFSTVEALDSSDVDGAGDVYEWPGGGSPALVTPAACVGECGAKFDAISGGADPAYLVFSTAEPLDPVDDTDTAVDIYRQPIGGSPVLVSRAAADCLDCGNEEGANAEFSSASADASHVAFTTAEGLAAEDHDEENDIYLRDDTAPGTTSLITTSPSYCPQNKGNCGATFRGTSSDGRHVFFSTVERFTPDDGDKEVDIYERFLGSPGPAVTRLVSAENEPRLELGPPPPVLDGTDPQSPASSTTPRVLGHEAEGESRIKLYATSDCQGEPVATGTAAELASPGLKVTVEPRSHTTFAATAEAEGFVSACSAPISYVEDSEAPPGGSPGGGGSGPGGGSSGGGIFRPGSGSSGTGVAAKSPIGPAYVIPRTRITFAPAAKTRSRNPIFRFTDSTGQTGTRFQCKVDRGPWRACGSPLRLKQLSRGRHQLEVLATNALGAAEPAPARRVFKVVPR
ncbi:MAG TPA: hypothetical protein VHA54_03545 [Solirubrobacterales bacterium]|nr:hypothetical protein [Solirubrobacterales bacterium]